MSQIETLIEDSEAPSDAPRERLDVRTAGPPAPLKQTLERLPQLDDDVVLVQRNDRVPQHLFPKLDDRGYRYETVETDTEVLTAIWKP